MISQCTVFSLIGRFTPLVLLSVIALVYTIGFWHSQSSPVSVIDDDGRVTTTSHSHSKVHRHISQLSLQHQREVAAAATQKQPVEQQHKKESTHPPVLNTDFIARRLPLIAPDYRLQCEKLIKGDPTASFSQAHQDWFLFSNYFADMNSPGVYIDIGANHAKEMSNSFFFDVCLGWKGICVEPNPNYASTYQNRSCRLIQKCVSHKKQNVTIDFGMGVFANVNSQGNTNAECITLTDLLVQNADLLGSPDSVGAMGSKVNFVSMDVEGSESTILSCLDFSIFSSLPSISGPGQIWTIETNKADKQLVYIDSAMTLGGFKKILPLFYGPGLLDDVYEMDRTKQIMRTPAINCRTSVNKATCSLAELLHNHGGMCS